MREGEIMERDDLKELLTMNIPDHKGNFDKVYEACKKANQSVKLKKTMLIQVLTLLIILCFVSFSSIMIYKEIQKEHDLTTIVPPRNEVLEDRLFMHLAFRGKFPKFDSYVAVGPEVGSNRFNLNVILNSNLLKEEDKNVLVEYSKTVKEKVPEHNVRFVVCLGAKDDKDYVFLADIYYDAKSHNGYEITTFYFESNLPYPFSSLADEFEELTGEILTTDTIDCITSYNDQNILECGIALCFEKLDDGTYKEYYLMKTYDKKQEFIVKK